MTLGSLFDGMGGFPLSATKFGIKTLWASEIEPLPMVVTRLHFPKMEHLGDITQIDGGKILPVDIITGGSPCQNLSVAGKGEGLDGKHSGLFFEQTRIIREMRESTNGQYPRYAVWENVPGAFSSNGGKDFREVIQEFANLTGAGISVPMPRGNQWKSSGVCVGNGASFGWRVIDAQFWGVPQRRRRIFLVADFAGERIRDILFVDSSLQGDITESKGTRETATARTGTRPKVAGFKGAAGAKAGGIGYSEEVSPTLLANQVAHVLELYENHGADSRVTGPLDVAPTVTRRAGTGGGNTPLVHTYSIAGNTIGRKPENGGNGIGVWEDISYTLTSTDRHAIAEIYAQQSYDSFKQGEMATIKASGGSYGGGSETLVCETTIGALCAGDEKRGQQVIEKGKWVIQNSVVRRMTPLEYERAQGFPDYWTEYGVGEKGNRIEISDSQRYMMCGNSVAIPCVDYILGNIATRAKQKPCG